MVNLFFWHHLTHDEELGIYLEGGEEFEIWTSLYYINICSSHPCIETNIWVKSPPKKTQLYVSNSLFVYKVTFILKYDWETRNFF